MINYVIILMLELIILSWCSKVMSIDQPSQEYFISDLALLYFSGLKFNQEGFLKKIELN